MKKKKTFVKLVGLQEFEMLVALILVCKSIKMCSFLLIEETCTSFYWAELKQRKEEEEWFSGFSGEDLEDKDGGIEY